MKNKSAKSRGYSSASAKLFSDPVRSRILWHDAKVFASASNIYLENMLAGVYGRMNSKLITALSHLHAAAVIQLITLEANSVVQKIELGALKLENSDQQATVLVESALKFLKPIFDEKDFTASVNLKKEATLSLDQRYGATIIYDLIFLATLLMDEKKPKLDVAIKNHFLSVSVFSSFSKKDLEKILSPDQIYSEGRVGSSLPALLHWVLKNFAKHSGVNFDLEFKNKKINLIYGQH